MREIINDQRMRFLSKGLLLILLLSGLFVAYLLIQPGGHQAVNLGDNLLQGLLEGVGLLLTLPLWLPGDGRMKSSARSLLRGRTGTNSTQRWVPLLLSLALVCYILGQAIWTYNENIAHLPVLFPSWADAGYLGSYPFVLLAILLLPHRPLSGQKRVRILLDSLIILIGMVTFSWYFVLGPTILQGADTIGGQIIGTAYPLATLVLIFCLLQLGSHRHDSELQSVVLLLFLALSIIVLTDSIYDYQELHNQYMTGGLLDVGWPLGYMLIGLSARAMQLRPASGIPTTVAGPTASPEKSVDPPSSLWRASIPLFFVPAALVLLAWTLSRGDSGALEPGVFFGVSMLLGLVVVRQVIVTHEMISQNHLLRRVQQDLWRRNEALHRANVQLEEQARIEAAYEQQRRLNELKDQLILNVSHELRTPLTQVSGYLELLDLFHHTLTSDKQAEYIQRATQGCEALLQLINTVLDAARIGEHSPHPQIQSVVVADLVHEMLEQFEPQQREHPVRLEIAEELIVQADLQFLRRVLRNLLSNAFKYSPPQAPVRVTALRGGPDAHRPQSRSQVCISVRDSGPGIPPEDIPLLFGKFVRLKRDLAGSIRGTGLGLYISKQLVEAMGGQIWVESSGVVGQGSCFSFTLPAGNQTL